MTVRGFFDKWNGRGIDWDNWYGFQCMDLYHQYDKECIGSKNYPAPAAKDVWNKYDSNFYTRIANTPTNIPQLGDIIIWGTVVGPYGHIAVFWAGDVINFTSFDQNWPVGSLSHFQVHSYKGVLGWLRPKQLPKDVIIPVTEPAPVSNPTPQETPEAVTSPSESPADTPADIPPSDIPQDIPTNGSDTPAIVVESGPGDISVADTIDSTTGGSDMGVGSPTNNEKVVVEDKPNALVQLISLILKKLWRWFN